MLRHKPNSKYITVKYEASCWTPERGFFIDNTPPPKCLRMTKKNFKKIHWNGESK